MLRTLGEDNLLDLSRGLLGIASLVQHQVVILLRAFHLRNRIPRTRHQLIGGLCAATGETLGKRLAVYRRNAGTGELVFDKHVPIVGSPDNVNVDAEGEVWVAVHARLLDLVRNFGDAGHASPTQIVRYVETDKRPLQTMYAQDGREISAGSVGAVSNGTLLIGSITDRTVLRCRLP